MPEPVIRAARESDLPSIAEINSYYVLNTVLTFHTEPRKLDEITATYESVKAQSFPCIVAADPSSGVILGYSYVSGFRGSKGAYEHTVELTLYCHPDQQGKGVGTSLLNCLLGALRDPSGLREYYPGPEMEAKVVRQVLAIMAVDEMGKGRGLKLKEFYERHGFELRGHMKGVGLKFGRWIDTMYLQLSL